MSHIQSRSVVRLSGGRSEIDEANPMLRRVQESKMSIFKKSEMKSQTRSVLRPLTTTETNAVGGGAKRVCQAGTHYYAGQCVKNSK
jgi:hypothetical protein